MAWAPAAISAIAAIGSALISSHSQKDAAKSAQQMQTEMIDNANKQTQLGRSLADKGDTVFGMGGPAYSAGLNYYKTLLGGNYSELMQAIAPDARSVNDLYSGAVKNVEQTGARGGTKDTALAGLNQSRTSQLAQLIPNARASAASALTGNGLGGINAAAGFGGAAGTNYGNAGLSFASLLGSNADRQRMNAQMWSQLGGSLGNILLPWLLNSNKSTSTATPGTSNLTTGGIGNITQTGAYGQ